MYEASSQFYSGAAPPRDFLSFHYVIALPPERRCIGTARFPGFRTPAVALGAADGPGDPPLLGARAVFPGFRTVGAPGAAEDAGAHPPLVGAHPGVWGGGCAGDASQAGDPPFPGFRSAVTPGAADDPGAPAPSCGSAYRRGGGIGGRGGMWVGGGM